MPSKKTLEHYLRQLRLIEEHREKWCEQNVRRHYKDLMTDLQEFLGVEYAQLAQDDKLTYEILHSKGQYARFIEEVERRTNKFSVMASQEIKDTVQLTYKKCFEGMVEAVQKSKNYDELRMNLKGIRAVTPEIIKNAVSNTFLEDALEKNHKAVIYDIKQQIGVGLSQGDRMSTMARRISEQLGKNYRKAVQITRTECHRIREAGYQDASEDINHILKDNDSGYVMTKTWKTMQDHSVRPYRRKGKKGFITGKGPDHVSMHGKTILVDEFFELTGGSIKAKAKAPGQSGVAGHDINCRCYLSRDLMTVEEYEKLTGKKLEDQDPTKKFEKKEQQLLDEKKQLEADYADLTTQKQDLESIEYTGLWKDPVTVADYEAKKGSIQAKREYFETEIENAKNRTGKYANATWYSDQDLENVIKKNKAHLMDLEDFELQGKGYIELTKELKKATDRLSDIDNQLIAIREKIMKLKGIDIDAMQDEIDDIIAQISKLTQYGEATPLNTLVKDVDPDKIVDYMYEALTKTKNTTHPKEAFEKIWKLQIEKNSDMSLKEFAEQTGMSDKLKEIFESKIKVSKNLTIKSKIGEFDEADLQAILSKITPGSHFDFTLWTDDTVKEWLEVALTPEQQTAFKKELKKLVKNNPNNEAKLKELQKKLADKQDELDKIRKRYNLVDDAFSQARKDAAYWFTDKNGGARAADGVLRDKCGEIWRNATAAQKKTAYEYTQSYHKYNEPLRGIEYGSGVFKGVGNIDFDDIGVSTGYGMKKGQVKKLIDDLTDLIDKSTYDFDIWVQRGCGYGGMDKFFNINPTDFYDLTEEQMKAKLLGTTPTEYAFMSTGVSKGKGLNISGQGVTLNIYAPKGTKMLYCEPFSAFGNGDGKSWDGKSKQSSFGHEAEMLLQRNTRFRVTKVEKGPNGRWFIDMEVISQER